MRYKYRRKLEEERKKILKKKSVNEKIISNFGTTKNEK